METTRVAVQRAERRLGGPGLAGYLIVALLVATSLVMYFAGASDLSGRGTWFVIGEASGIAGAALLAIVVILASRVVPIEWMFGDLTRGYVAHAVLGMTMFALISVHPLLYVVGTLPQGADSAAHVIVPFHLVALDWVSYIAIATALVLTLYVRMPFARWRLSHLLLGGAMVLTGYSILIENHAFDTVQIPSLRIFLFVLFGLGTAAFLWVAGISRFFDRKREYRITSVKHHPEAQATELRAVPVGKRVKFKAGQFVYADIVDDLLQIKRGFEAHPFSITTSPDQEEIGLVVGVQGAVTEQVQQMAASDDARLLLHTAHGRLTLDSAAQPKQLWIAGGIGITPFMSLAEEMAAHPDRYPDHDVTLVTGVDERSQAFYWDRIRECADRCPALEARLWDRRERGLPTVEGIAELVDGDLSDYTVLMSGPEPMIANLTEQLEAAGVPRGRIRWEREIGPPKHWRQAAPALRRMRWVVTATFGVFAVAVVVATVGRAIT